MNEINLNEKSPLSKAIPKKVINVEMFRAGEQTDSDGDKALFTERDLEDIISTYNPSTHEAPLIVGHDQDDSTPSLGWVRQMWRKGKSLWGKIELTPKAEKLISEGIFKKVSSSFYAPEADANPYPGKLALRHLALVNIPAVKGLADFREHLSETITVDFSEQRSQALFKELLDKNISIMAKPRKKKISNHAEGPMHVTINVGGSSGPGEDLPFYDDGGNQLSKNGTPVDYYEDEEELDGDPDFPEDFPEEEEDLESIDADFADEEELPPEEGMDEELPPEEGESEELPPEEGEGMDEELPPEEGLEEPEAEAEVPEGFSTDEPEDVEGSDDIEDISDEMEGDDAKITELATNFSALELAKALMLQKETKDMMETENTSDFSECSEDKDKEKEGEDESEDYSEEEVSDFSDCEDKDKEKDESEDYSEDSEEAPEFAEDSDEEESEDYSEDGDSKPDFLKKKESESECDSEDKEDFAEDGDESESLKARVARLEKELSEQKKLAREKDISDFCEKVYQGGKLTEQIVTKTDLVRFMSSLNGKNTMNFSEGSKRSQFDFFSDVLENLPQLVNFSEVAPDATAPTKKKAPAPESGYAYENSNLELHTKALEFSEAKGVDYITALKTVIDL